MAKGPKERRQSLMNALVVAMELPFVFVGAVLGGLLIGWLLDRALHTSPVLTLVFMFVGLAAGLREILRRIPKDEGTGDGNSRANP
jgi:ATP synthase protein I